ncbi:MAG: hypothetical protein ACFFD1_04615, partial [Candidatus Thorarchaeota archaeon]
MTKQKLISKQKKKKETDKLTQNLKKYRKELENLEKKYNGMISAEIVSNEAQKKQSPLHDWFDWEDNIAGEKWRLHQARLLINSIKVKIIFEKGVNHYRKYLNVNIKDDDGESQRFYVT